MADPVQTAAASPAATPAADPAPTSVSVKVRLADAYANLALTLPKGGVVDPADPTIASMIDRGILEVVG